MTLSFFYFKGESVGQSDPISFGSDSEEIQYFLFGTTIQLVSNSTYQLTFTLEEYPSDECSNDNVFIQSQTVTSYLTATRRRSALSYDD